MDLCFSLSRLKIGGGTQNQIHMGLILVGRPASFLPKLDTDVRSLQYLKRGFLLALSGVKGGGKKGHETCGSPSYPLDRFVLHVKNYSSSSSTFFGKLDHKSVCSLGVKAFACLVLLRVVVLHHCTLGVGLFSLWTKIGKTCVIFLSLSLFERCSQLDHGTKVGERENESSHFVPSFLVIVLSSLE